MSDERPLIVVVDDDFDALEIIRHILEPAGYRALCFTDPMEALDHMAKEKPRLVITDLMMKFIDTGFAFSRQIKFDARFGNIPVILVTAAFSQRRFAIQPKASKDLERMGIDAFFDKPVEAEELLKKVRQLLGQTTEERIG
jgi:chemosensory pili system protein ChpA (sensor histidine kinase/response regulator)